MKEILWINKLLQKKTFWVGNSGRLPVSLYIPTNHPKDRMPTDLVAYPKIR